MQIIRKQTIDPFCRLFGSACKKLTNWGLSTPNWKSGAAQPKWKHKIKYISWTGYLNEVTKSLFVFWDCFSVCFPWVMRHCATLFCVLQIVFFIYFRLSYSVCCCCCCGFVTVDSAWRSCLLFFLLVVAFNCMRMWCVCVFFSLSPRLKMFVRVRFSPFRILPSSSPSKHLIVFLFC